MDTIFLHTVHCIPLCVHVCVYNRLEVLSSPVEYSEAGLEARRYAAFHTYDRVMINEQLFCVARHHKVFILKANVGY